MMNQLKASLYLMFKQAKGSGMRHHMQWMEDNQFKTAEALRTQRDALLLRLLEQAYHNVPGQRLRMEEAGVYTRNRFVLSNLVEMPPLQRVELQENSKAFTNRHANTRKLYYCRTGGTTGTPLELVQDAHYRDWCLASHYFFNAWNGMRLGTPFFFLWAAPQEVCLQLNSLKQQVLMEQLLGRRILNCITTSPEVFSEYIRTINHQRDCHYLLAYANELYALACHSLEHDEPIKRRLKGIYATATSLTPRMRDTIEHVFGCLVYNRYGSRDAGDVASECEHRQGLHINPMYSLVEVVDENGYPVPHGQEGEILITLFHNHTMPLIRYAIGDVGVMQGPERCHCGRRWENLVQITGRTSERLYLPNGLRYGGIYIETAFEENLPHVHRYQIHQLSTEHLLVKLRTPIPDYLERYRKELDEVSHMIRQWANHPFHIEYEVTDDLYRAPSGKEPVIVHRLDQPAQPEKSLVLSAS